MDDLGWAQNAVREMEFQCVTQSIQRSPSTDQSVPDSTQVVRHICPNQCSDRGKCVQGRCVCQQGIWSSFLWL